jgi:hypothetical protein
MRSVLWDMSSIFSWCISSHQHKSWGIVRCIRGVSCPNNISRNKCWTWGELCLSVLCGLHKYRYPSFYKLCCSEQLIFVFVISYFCESREVHTQHAAGGRKQTSPPACISHHPSLSTCLVLITQIQLCSWCLHFINKCLWYLCPTWLLNKRNSLWGVGKPKK